MWAKVTKTPFETRADLVQGYGRGNANEMKRSYISKDCPREFVNPENVRQPTNRMDER